MDIFGRITIRSPAKLAAALLFCIIAGSLGSLVTVTRPGSWYALLAKPSFQPPNWVFAPVWTVLFFLMGTALYLVWETGIGKPGVRYALYLFFVQFAFNILWSFLFFGLRSPLLGLLDIIVLWCMILATIMAFYKVRKSAVYLLLPYFAWVSFATILNAGIYFLNP
ncbi:MAG: TspO/MBR family protein [Methanoregula sp. PtaU1.Bin051]|nr:MAG: TspO/MBR family protein [Methanoregula sp. PtaU1.Bin051]